MKFALAEIDNFPGKNRKSNFIKKMFTVYNNGSKDTYRKSFNLKY